MIRRCCFIFLLPVFGISFGQGPPPIGQWREHLPWNNAINVALASPLIICATPYSVFTYDTEDGTFTRRSKMNGLSDVGVRTMGYDPVSGNTVIAYTNGNIDVWKEDRVINIPDIHISTVPGDKTINRIYINSDKAYLSTGLGIIILNLEKNEVGDTWRIGTNGTEVKTFGVTISGQVIYAATEEGLKSASVSSNLSDYRNWTVNPGYGLRPGPCDQVLSAEGKIYVNQADSLFAGNGNSFSFLYASGSDLLQVDTASGGLLVSETINGKGRVTQISSIGAVIKTFLPATLSKPRQALLLGSECWIADHDNGLTKTNGTISERIFPNSPINIASGEIKFLEDGIWSAAGKVTEAWNYTFNPNGLYRFSGEQWTGYNLYVYPKIDSLLDFVTVTSQPSTGSIYAGSFGGGLLEITKDNQLVIYKQNSPLQPAIGDPTSYRVSGLATDMQNNIWISNFGAPQNLLVKKADGQWQRFSIPFFHLENAVGGITIDDYDQKWIISPKENGLFLFNSGSSIDNTGDDRWRFFRKGKGSGNLPSSNVFCAVKDRNGFIWVGTDNGIGIIQCVQDAAVNNCEAVLPIVKQDNFAGYLFQGEEVRAIAVDGANRKWVGTENGLWLISEEGEKIVYRFTIDNSPLLDNDISAITLDPGTGEVFISTAKGICSFRGTATEGAETHTNVLVYPNPVPPGYRGTIAIKGLASNAQVKIIEMDGRLVYQVRALGGQATWDGRNYKGNFVASGVYTVLATDEQNREKVAAKIFFIR
jgi:hypothetical protein